MKAVVILEGIDGAGKSTLAQQLRRQLDATYVHHGSYTSLRGDQIARLYHQTLEPALTDTANVVLDRAWHSEPIYGEVFRTGLDRVRPWRRMLDRCLLTVPHVIVYLSPQFELAWNVVRARAREELPQRREQLERLLGGYEAGHMSWAGNVVRVTRDDRGLSETAEEMIAGVRRDLADGRAGTRLAALREHGVIGNLYGPERERVLLVGEAPSPRATTALPFVSHTLGGCSAWLAEYLEAERIDETALLWVNAYRADETETDLSAVVALLPQIRVVALGKLASIALTARSIAHVAVPHPQRVKRFAYHEAHAYSLGAAIRGN